MDGIREGRLYILTDHDWDDRITSRTNAILASVPSPENAP